MLFLYFAVMLGALIAGIYSLIHGAPKRKAEGAFGLVVASLLIVIGPALEGLDPQHGIASIAVPTLKIVLGLTPFIGAFITASAMATAKVDRMAKLI